MSNEVEIQGEPEPGSLNPELQKDAVETKARAKGWKPLAEWKGAPEDWVDAKEYVGRQKLFDRIEDLKGELGRQSSRFERDLGTITSHFEKMREADYQRAKEELKAQLKQARREDDPDREELVEEKIEQLDKEHEEAKAARAAQQPKQQSGPTPQFQEWHKENPWFQTNVEMTQEAIAIGTGYAALHPQKPQADVLAHVTARIKKLYPEAFESGEPEEKPQQRSGPEVESGNGGRKSTVSSAKKGKLTVADLDPEQREIMRVLIKRGALKYKAAKNKVTQEEQYLRDIEEYEIAENSRKARR